MQPTLSTNQSFETLRPDTTPDIGDLPCARSERQDAAFFSDLFERYYDFLCRQATALLRCHQKAEDAVCDVFIKIWQNRDLLLVATKTEHYLCRAVRNQAIDYLRREARENAHRNKITIELNIYESSAQKHIELHELNEKLELAIAMLPKQGQHIFRLSREEGLKYREIADLLDISVKTVETHMRRSLIQLRACLSEELAA